MSLGGFEFGEWCIELAFPTVFSFQTVTPSRGVDATMQKPAGTHAAALATPQKENSKTRLQSRGGRKTQKSMDGRQTKCVVKIKYNNP